MVQRCRWFLLEKNVKHEKSGFIFSDILSYIFKVQNHFKICYLPNRYSKRNKVLVLFFLITVGKPQIILRFWTLKAMRWCFPVVHSTTILMLWFRYWKSNIILCTGMYPANNTLLASPRDLVPTRNVARLAGVSVTAQLLGRSRRTVYLLN